VANPDPAGPSDDILLADQPLHNADFEWDSFDSAAYFDKNYREVRHDDGQIVRILSEFFSEAASGIEKGSAIDVGSGANLYPALAMLPFARDITLSERARANREWLDDQLRAPADSWSDFWSVMSAGRRAYTRLRRPFGELARRATVVRGDIFDLPANTWDLGTMFFVAESITRIRSEFDRATHTFVRALRPGAPFSAAFMKESDGYAVGRQSFPAFAVNEGYVSACLHSVAHDIRVHSIESHDLRPGYDGMILVTGRAGRPTR